MPLKKKEVAGPAAKKVAGPFLQFGQDEGQENTVRRVGSLYQRIPEIGAWKKRFFVLTNTTLLSFAKEFDATAATFDPEDESSKNLKGAFRLSAVTVRRVDATADLGGKGEPVLELTGSDMETFHVSAAKPKPVPAPRDHSRLFGKIGTIPVAKFQAALDLDGTDLDAQYATLGGTLLTWAAEAHRSDLVELLISRGADPAQTSRPRADPFVGTVPGMDALAWATATPAAPEEDGAADRRDATIQLLSSAVASGAAAAATARIAAAAVEEEKSLAVTLDEWAEAIDASIVFANIFDLEYDIVPEVALLRWYDAKAQEAVNESASMEASSVTLLKHSKKKKNRRDTRTFNLRAPLPEPPPPPKDGSDDAAPPAAPLELPPPLQTAAMGASAKALKAGGFKAVDLRKAGYSIAELKLGGFTAPELLAAGFAAVELEANGLTEDSPNVTATDAPADPAAEGESAAAPSKASSSWGIFSCGPFQSCGASGGVATTTTTTTTEDADSETSPAAGGDEGGGEDEGGDAETPAEGPEEPPAESSEEPQEPEVDAMTEEAADEEGPEEGPEEAEVEDTPRDLVVRSVLEWNWTSYQFLRPLSTKGPNSLRLSDLQRIERPQAEAPAKVTPPPEADTAATKEGTPAPAPVEEPIEVVAGAKEATSEEAIASEEDAKAAEPVAAEELAAAESQKDGEEEKAAEGETKADGEEAKSGETAGVEEAKSEETAGVEEPVAEATPADGEEKVVAEEPVPEAAVDGDAVVEEESKVEESVVEEPVVAEPEVVEEPAAANEPVVVDELAAVEEPLALEESAAVEEPAAEEPAEEPTEEPAEEPTEEPAEEPTTEEAAAPVETKFTFVTSAGVELTVEPLEGESSDALEAWLKRVERIVYFLQLEQFVGEKVAASKALYAEIRALKEREDREAEEGVAAEAAEEVAKLAKEEEKAARKAKKAAKKAAKEKKNSPTAAAQ